MNPVLAAILIVMTLTLAWLAFEARRIQNQLDQILTSSVGRALTSL